MGKGERRIPTRRSPPGHYSSGTSHHRRCVPIPYTVIYLASNCLGVKLPRHQVTQASSCLGVKLLYISLDDRIPVFGNDGARRFQLLDGRENGLGIQFGGR